MVPNTRHQLLPLHPRLHQPTAVDDVEGHFCAQAICWTFQAHGIKHKMLFLVVVLASYVQKQLGIPGTTPEAAFVTSISTKVLNFSLKIILSSPQMSLIYVDIIMFCLWHESLCSLHGWERDRMLMHCQKMFIIAQQGPWPMFQDVLPYPGVRGL